MLHRYNITEMDAYTNKYRLSKMQMMRAFDKPLQKNSSWTRLLSSLVMALC